MNAKNSLVIAIAAWAALLAVSFWFSIYLGYGPAESAHDPASLWMYVRRVLLLACALVLPVLAGGEGARTYGWRLTLKWLLIALPIGIALGFVNPGGFDPSLVSAILLAGMHTFATELFFRAYLVTTLSVFFKKFWPPIIISSVMYGIFYLTVATVWEKNGWLKLIFVGLFTMIGLLYGYCYKKSQSFYVPWIMHFFSVLNYNLLF